MSDPGRATVAIGVTGRPLPFSVSWPEVAAAAAGRFSELARALGVPVDLEIQAVEQPAQAEDGAPPYDVRIGGADARLRHGVPLPQDPKALVDQLWRDLVANRALLVAPEVAQMLRAAPGAATSPPMADDAWLQLLRECLTIVTPVSHVWDAGAAAPSAGGRWQRLEDAAAFKPALDIRVPPGYLDASGPAAREHASNRLGESIYDATGVIIPAGSISEAGDPGANVEVRIRQALVPVTLGTGDALARLAGALRPWLHCLVTEPTIAVRVSGVRERFPRLVDGVRRRFGLPFITRVCRTLVRDGLSVRDMRTVLEGLLDIRAPGTADEVALIVFHAPTGTPRAATALAEADDDRGAVDCVRRWCRRMVSVTHWQSGSLLMRLLTTEVEQCVRDGAFAPGSAPQRALLRQMTAASHPILTTVDVRQRLADAIALERPDVAVLCYQELLPEANITSTQRITLR